MNKTTTAATLIANSTQPATEPTMPNHWILNETPTVSQTDAGRKIYRARHRKNQRLTAEIIADRNGILVSFAGALPEVGAMHAATLATEAYSWLVEAAAGNVGDGNGTDLEVDARELGLGRVRLDGEDARLVVLSHFDASDPDLFYVGG